MGEYVCQSCARVVMDRIDDFGLESNSSDYEERSKNTRASGYSSFSMHDYGLRTEIGSISKDYAGKGIDYKMQEQMTSVRKWHTRIRVASSKERRLSKVLFEINTICSVLCLPKTLAETAALLYRNFENKNEVKGKSITSMAAATIYLACKRRSVIRSLDEIVNATTGIHKHRSKRKLASKYFTKMVMEMGAFTKHTEEICSSMSDPLKQNLANSDVESEAISASNTITTTSTPIIVAIDRYISKLVNSGGIDSRAGRLAVEIAHKSNNHFLADGKSPNGLSAAYIFVAATLLGVNIPQNDLSSLAGTTEVTIRNRCKDILTSFKITIKVKPLMKRLSQMI
jgi:transcription initiation factor TFIIB